MSATYLSRLSAVTLQSERMETRLIPTLPLTVEFSAFDHNERAHAAVSTQESWMLRTPHQVRFHSCFSWAPQEPSPFQYSDPAALIATALKRTPGAGRERVIDPDNLTSPACAPETYAGSAGAVGDEPNSNPITGDWHLVARPACGAVSAP